MRLEPAEERRVVVLTRGAYGCDGPERCGSGGFREGEDQGLERRRWVRGEEGLEKWEVGGGDDEGDGEATGE